MVTHDLELLTDFDRVLVFDQTRLVHDGPPREAIASYKRLMR
jgi:biotin transport system ATP-binding protein